MSGFEIMAYLGLAIGTLILFGSSIYNMFEAIVTTIIDKFKELRK